MAASPHVELSYTFFRSHHFTGITQSSSHVTTFFLCPAHSMKYIQSPAIIPLYLVQLVVKVLTSFISRYRQVQWLLYTLWFCTPQLVECASIICKHHQHYGWNDPIWGKINKTRSDCPLYACKSIRELSPLDGLTVFCRMIPKNQILWPVYGVYLAILTQTFFWSLLWITFISLFIRANTDIYRFAISHNILFFKKFHLLNKVSGQLYHWLRNGRY